MEEIMEERNEKEYLQAYEKSLSLWPISYSTYYVNTSYGQTHVIESGVQDGPPLVLLHGASMSSTMWYPNVHIWGKKYRIYAIDIMGDKNKSIVEKEFTSRRAYADWLMEVLDALDVQKADIVGLSFGALNAMNFILHEPNRVKRAVLISPAETFVSFDPLFYQYAFGMVQNKEGVQQFLNWIFKERYQLHPFIHNQLEAAFMWVNPNRSSKPTQSGFPYVCTDEELLSIQTPILLLLGENEVMYNPIEAMERAKSFIPNIDVEIVEGAGHLLSMEKPDSINERVLNYFQEK